MPSRRALFLFLSLNFSVSYICTTESGTKRGRGLGLGLVPAPPTGPHLPRPTVLPLSLFCLVFLSLRSEAHHTHEPHHCHQPRPSSAHHQARPGQTRHQTTHAASGTVASCCYATLLPIKSQSFSSETRGKIKRIIKSTRDTHYTYHSQTLGLCAMGWAAQRMVGGWVGGGSSYWDFELRPSVVCSSQQENHTGGRAGSCSRSALQRRNRNSESATQQIPPTLTSRTHAQSAEAVQRRLLLRIGTRLYRR